jgi:probable HAF family extracellular repeat protein
MKSIPSAPKWPRIARLSLALATVAGPVYVLAQSTAFLQYTVVDLGPVGPSSSPGQPYTVSGKGLVSGETVLANPNNSDELVAHAVLWNGTTMKDISSPGLGGPNSAAYGVNIWGQVVGQADTTTPDPNGEDFCGSKALGLTQSGNTCVPFLWQNGSMIALPRLRNSDGKEGSNGLALQVNDFGIAAGTAENGELDSTCPGASVSAQRIELKPVIWTRPFPWSEMHVHELHTFDGEPDGVAFAMNNLGQVVGATGTCGPFNSIEPINLIALHAVLWQNGKAIDLGNLGRDGKAFGVFATGLNDYGQVVGTSDTAGDKSFHAFLWQQGHITDLGTLKGDSYSHGTAIGNNGLVLGVSIDANFNPRAVMWHNGTPTDMNTLVPADSTLILQSACSINDKGEIIGFAALKSNPNESHAYLAKPVVSSWDGD